MLTTQKFIWVLGLKSCLAWLPKIMAGKSQQLMAPSDLQSPLPLPQFFRKMANGVYLIAFIKKTLVLVLYKVAWAGHWVIASQSRGELTQHCVALERLYCSLHNENCPDTNLIAEMRVANTMGLIHIWNNIESYYFDTTEKKSIFQLLIARFTYFCPSRLNILNFRWYQ